MSSISSGGQIQGPNWSIERGLIGPEVAEQGAREIMDAIATGNEMVSFDHEQPHNRYRGYLIDGLGELTKKQIAAPGFGFTALMEARKALQPFKDPALLKDRRVNHYDQGMINVTAAGGRVPLHRDKSTWSLVFVNLRGFVSARVEDLENGGFIEETLTPGDGLRIVNPAKKKMRPRHEITNLSNFARVSYGEYTNQFAR